MQKRLKFAEIKDADKGLVDLVFATFDVIDKDGDVTTPGAFEDGAKCPVSAYGHTSWEGKLPVGVATIRQTAKEAQAEAQFFLDTVEGLETFTTVKRLHKEGLGDWSYGYDPLDYSFGEKDDRRVRFLKQLHVHEISPVLVGAGVGTRTTGVKAHPGGGAGGEQGGRSRSGWSGAIAPHTTRTVKSAWRPDAVRRQLPMDATIIDLRATHAWCDPDADPTTKGAYRFLHHEAPDGPANLRACAMGIAALNTGRAPSGMSDDAVKGVYEHLATHLRDAELVPPELRAGGSTLKLNDRLLNVLADVTDVIAECREVGAARALKSKGLTVSTTLGLDWLREELKGLDTLLNSPDDDLRREYLRMIAENLRAGE